MKLIIGADHRGFTLKNILIHRLSHFSFIDITGTDLKPDDDYPLVAQAVAKQVLENPANRGIVFCGSGAGVDIAANKIDGIRCALGLNPEQVAAARRDDDINMLAIAADYINEEQGQEMIQAFVSTEFEPSEKHTRRLDEITKIENDQ